MVDLKIKLEKNSALLLFIILIGFLIRVWNLPNKAFGVDEELTLKVTNSVSEAIAFSNSDFYPPLSHALFVPLLASFGVVGTRIFLAILSSFAVLLFYFFSKKFFEEEEALLSTMLFAIMPLNVFYSAHLRQYPVLIFLNLLAAYCFISLLQKFSWKHILLFSFACILMGYIHYTSWLYVLAFGILIVIFFRKRTQFKIFLGAIATILACLALLLPLALSQYSHFTQTHYYKEKNAFNLSSYLYIFYKLAVGINISSALSFCPLLLFAAVLVLLFLAIGFWLFLHEKEPKARVLSIYFLLSLALFFFASLKAPMLASFRYLSPTMPVFVLFLSKGLFSIGSKKSAIANIIIALFWLIAICYYYSVFTQPDWNKFIGL